MTGKIKQYSSVQGKGTITSERGEELFFEIGDVLAFDRLGLRPGKVVGFTEGDRIRNRAFEVFLCSGLGLATIHDKNKQSENLRFAGFRMEQGLRVYYFEQRTEAAEIHRYVIETDVSQLIRRKISLQETPTLCLALLLHHVESRGFSPRQGVMRIRMTEGDIDQFAIRRRQPEQRMYPRPNRFRPTVAPAEQA